MRFWDFHYITFLPLVYDITVFDTVSAIILERPIVGDERFLYERDSVVRPADNEKHLLCMMEICH